jgi:hypothetical protein
VFTTPVIAAPGVPSLPGVAHATACTGTVVVKVLLLV